MYSHSSSSLRTLGTAHNGCHHAWVPGLRINPHGGLSINPHGGLLHFAPLPTYIKEHQAHVSRALVVLTLLILVSVLTFGVGVCTGIRS